MASPGSWAGSRADSSAGAAARGADRALQVVCFCVGAQEYGLDILRVKEVINPVPITPMPDAPDFLEGIIDLRGAFLGVVDLRKRLGKRLGKAAGAAAGPVTPQHKYVITKVDDQKIGLVVERVTEVRRLDPATVAPAATGGPGCIAGVVRGDHGVLLLLDADRLLTAEERAALAR